MNGLFKTELIRRHGPWRTIESVELATLGWVDWWNHRRLHGACNDVPPAEFEARYYAQQPAVPVARIKAAESPPFPGRFTPLLELGLEEPRLRP